MSKSDQIALGWNQGLAFALKIAAEAQQAGKDPVEALRTEMRARRLMGLQILATQKELDKASETIKATTAKTMLSACMVVLWEQFGFGKVRLTRLMEHFMTYVMALNEGSIGWFDITDLLYEKTGITIDLTDDDIRGKVRTE
jgi:hypothetical protein